MCYHGYRSRETFEDEIARKLRDDDATADVVDEIPSFLNEERDAEVEILTDGGDSPSADDSDT